MVVGGLFDKKVSGEILDVVGRVRVNKRSLFYLYADGVQWSGGTSSLMRKPGRMHA